MGSILYLTIEQSSQSSGYSYLSPSRTTGSESPDRTDDFLRINCTPPTLATCWEMLIVSFCSVITTSYTLHNELRVALESHEQILAFDPGHVTFIFDPSPVVMLGACLVLGCAISSFAYRRQDGDRFQAPIFVFAITAATVFGLAMDVNANIVMLALIPWALCGAMIFSTGVHWFLRRCFRERYSRTYCCEIGEKGVLVGN
ncbi:hypothetical protein LSUE1_G008886 [Lachnellula suecica]|uniref:Uncharacterized protein n=1 Tax=Lachnellula suecica TaxID=602035 RepID=A0A8T9BWJ4_9HELO|nr:hypothetical protein LSUE1_G008886 [Lachnellula suecica]